VELSLLYFPLRTAYDLNIREQQEDFTLTCKRTVMNFNSFLREIVWVYRDSRYSVHIKKLDVYFTMQIYTQTLTSRKRFILLIHQSILTKFVVVFIIAALSRSLSKTRRWHWHLFQVLTVGRQRIHSQVMTNDNILQYLN